MSSTITPISNLEESSPVPLPTAPRRISLRPQTTFKGFSSHPPLDSSSSSSSSSSFSWSSPTSTNGNTTTRNNLGKVSQETFNRNFHASTSNFQNSNHVFRSNLNEGGGGRRNEEIKEKSRYQQVYNENYSANSSSSSPSSSSSSSRYDVLNEEHGGDDDDEESEETKEKKRNYFRSSGRGPGRGSGGGGGGGNGRGRGGGGGRGRGSHEGSSESAHGGVGIAGKYQQLPNLPNGTLSLYYLSRIPVQEDFELSDEVKKAFSLTEIKSLMETGFSYRLPIPILNKLQEIHCHLAQDKEALLPILNFKKSIVKMENFESLVAKSAAAVMVTEEEKESIVVMIRILLNKLASKNFEETKNKILQAMLGSATGARETSELLSVMDLIFEIAAANKFYANLYAELFACIVGAFPGVFLDKIQERLLAFRSQFEDIQMGNPDEDYDAFCALKKINDRRIFMSAFYLQLLKVGLIPLPNYIDFLEFLLSEITDNLNVSHKKDRISQFSENFFAAFDKTRLELQERFGMRIQRISGYKVKDYKGLTSKTIFTFLDIVSPSKK